MVWGKEGPLRASRRPKAAAGRARCDEGSYGHRQQGKGPSFPQKNCLHMEEAQGGHTGDHAGIGQLAVEEGEALQFAFAQAEGQAFVVIDGQFLARQGAAVAGEVEDDIHVGKGPSPGPGA